MLKAELKYIAHDFYYKIYGLFFAPCFFLIYESRYPAITAITSMMHDSTIPVMSLPTIETVMPITPIAANAN